MAATRSAKDGKGRRTGSRTPKPARGASRKAAPGSSKRAAKRAATPPSGGRKAQGRGAKAERSAKRWPPEPARPSRGTAGAAKGARSGKAKKVAPRAAVRAGAAKGARKPAAPAKRGARSAGDVGGRSAATERPARTAPPRPAAPTSRARREARSEDEHFRAKLLDQRAAILKNLEELRDELRGLQEPSHELEEWAQEEKERDILILQEQRQEEELTRVQIALQRIEQGSYGQCARCGRRITKERLEEVPTAVFCRHCQP